MRYKEIVKYSASKAGAPVLVARRVLRAFGSALRLALADGQKVTIYGLGTFFIRDVGSKLVVSVNTGQKVATRACRKIRFRPSGLLKKRVQRSFFPT